MRESLLPKLCCPEDLGPLSLTSTRLDTDGHVIEGSLVCQRCRARYAIERGVPQMLPSSLADVDHESLEALQAATIDRFGYEWRHYRDWGWLEDYPDVPQAEERFFGGLLRNSEGAFWSKSLYKRDELGAEHLVLDAGCGNGRFTYQACLTGAEVIGVDLGWGVDSAFENTRALPNVHIVRGDLFRLPLRTAIFDRIFSIGVLMHTGDAQAAFASIVRTLAPGGLVVAHVYGVGRPSYELLDRSIRAVTTRLPRLAQMGFSKILATVSRELRQGGPRAERLYRRLYSHLNLLPTDIHMFDWWAAPIATHHTPRELQRWFDGHGLEILRTNPPRGDASAEARRQRIHAAVTFLGRRPALG